MSNTSENDVSVCANCGKEGSDVTNTCNKCKSIKYCNAACKKRHRHKHKKDCEECVKRVAELHDEKLFKQPPQLYEDCLICMIRLPTLIKGRVYMSCCGKIICSGCVHAFQSRATKEEQDVCPFYRTPPPKSDAEYMKRYKKRIELKDARALHNLGCFYNYGKFDLSQNHEKALELWHRAAELGDALAYGEIGIAYYNGNGVERDENKAKRYYELAATAGDTYARHNVGCVEEESGTLTTGGFNHIKRDMFSAQMKM